MRTGPKGIPTERVVQLWNEGLILTAIGRKLGCSGVAAREHLKKAGVYDKEKVKLRVIKYFRQSNAGVNNPFYGKHHSPETKRQLSNAKKGNIPWSKGIHPKDDERIARLVKAAIVANRGRIPWNKGLTKETDQRVRRYAEGVSKYAKPRTGAKNPFYGRRHSERTKIQISRKKKQQFKENEEYRKSVFRSRRPTDLEQCFIQLCRKHGLPFRYVGNGEFWLGRMNPDFIDTNGRKIAVEVLGDFWHNEDEFNNRVQRFARQGWICLGIWGHDLDKLSEQEIVEKVRFTTRQARPL